MGTANRKPQFGVPTIFVRIVVPTNLSEHPIGNQFSVPTIHHIVDLLPYRIDFLLEHQVYCSDKFVGTAVPIMFVGTALFPQICRNSILFKILRPNVLFEQKYWDFLDREVC